MKKNKLAIIFVSLFFLISLPKASFAADNLLVVFDASGSMLTSFGGSTRISEAKSALGDLLNSLDPSVKVAVRPFADVAQSTKDAACKQTELAIPFTTDRSAVNTKITSIQAVGAYTGTAYALTQAAGDFTAGQNNALILLTDGGENCGGDPAAAAATLLAAGVKVKTYVIGIDVDAAARAQLFSVATSGGGQYFDASDDATLASSLKTIQAAEKPIDKTNTDSSFGTPIRGGNGYDTTVDIIPGRYHLDHDQKNGDFDYFKLAVKAGVPVTFKIVSSPVAGLGFDPDTNTFGPNIGNSHESLSGFKIQDSDRADITSAYTLEPSAKDTKVFTPSKDGFVYVLLGFSLGGSENAMSKDTTFTIETGDTNKSAGTVSSGNAGINNENTAAGASGSSASAPANSSANTAAGSTLLYVAIGIGALIVLLFVVLIIVMLKRKGPPSVPPLMPQTPNVPPQIPPSVPPMPPQAGI